MAMSDWAGMGEDATLITMAQHFSVIFTSLCDWGVRPQGLPDEEGLTAKEGHPIEAAKDEGDNLGGMRAAMLFTCVRRTYVGSTCYRAASALRVPDTDSQQVRRFMLMYYRHSVRKFIVKVRLYMSSVFGTLWQCWCPFSKTKYRNLF